MICSKGHIDTREQKDPLQHTWSLAQNVLPLKAKFCLGSLVDLWYHSTFYPIFNKVLIYMIHTIQFSRILWRRSSGDK